MKVEEIAEAVAKLPPDQLTRFRRWFTAFEAGRANHAEELDSAATKLGRLAGRAFAEQVDDELELGGLYGRSAGFSPLRTRPVGARLAKQSVKFDP